MNYLVLVQYRESSEYNDFIGKYYHFPQKYLTYFPKEEMQFIYFEPAKKGKGEYFGYGRILKPPFKDKREDGFYFIEIEEYKPFLTPVSGPIEEAPYYNPQNAVRKIEEKLFEEICLDGEIQLNFKADSHLIEILGEQLIASEKIGILELIKNAYDANASICNVIIENVVSLPQVDKKLFKFNDFEGPVIVIEDNGTGMDRNVIEKGWLRPASTLKTNIKEKLKEERKAAFNDNKLGAYDEIVIQLKKAYHGRIPLGEKGVGRFATQRLGKKLQLKTKVKEKTFEYVLEIDWEKFKALNYSNVDLDSIGVTLRRQSPSRNYGSNDSGTQLIIYGGKEGFEWDEEKIRDLNHSIISLNSPSNKVSNFQAKLICPQLPDLPKQLLNEDFKPNIIFDGSINDKGIIDYKMVFDPPSSVPLPRSSSEDKLDLRKSDIPYWKQGELFRKPRCGGFKLKVEVWYREKPWIDGPNATDFTKFLDIFGGIAIYRDGINIFPAEKGKETDWLGLSRRQVKQTYRMSYYHMIGSIEIDQAYNFELTDKTNREGLIENQAYKDLKKLILSILTNIIEIEYIAKRDKYNSLTNDIIKDPKTLEQYANQSTNIVTNLKRLYPITEDPYNILKGLGAVEVREERLVNLERSLKSLQKSLQAIEESKALLTEHAGFGIAIAVSIHELAKITSNFYYGINDILKRGLDKTKLEELKEASLSIRSELKRLSPLRAVRSEKRIEFTIKRAIQYVIDIYKKNLIKDNIVVETNYDNDIKIYGRYGAILQVLSNLFSNSIYWLNDPEVKEKKIRIEVNSKHRYVIFADNGPGIHDSIRPYLFEPGYSLKTPASGLGLYICKYYMQDIKGDIYLTNSRECLPELNGAQFTLDFYRVADSKEYQL